VVFGSGGLAMANVHRRDPPKTWSLLGEIRKKPSEYEIVTAKLHYHYRRQPAPFELDPNTPINTWYRTYREGSNFQTDDWEGFRDPHQMTYRAYVEGKAGREAYLDNLIDEFENRNHEKGLQRQWVDVLGRLYLPARFAMHTLQMTGLYVGQMAPSSYVTNAAYFQAADELRRIQWTAYRAKSLSLEHYVNLGSSAYIRERWEEDAAWQPLRETVEKMLIAYDWGEAFAALNLTVKPVFDAVFNVQLAELARANEDALLAMMLDDFTLDSQRSCDWTIALVQYAVAQRPANIRSLRQWVDQWEPMAYRGMEGVVELFAHAPHPLEARAVSANVRAAHHAFLDRCGLNGGEQAFVFAQNIDGHPNRDLEVTPMATEMRKSGIDVIGDMVAWGAHFCLFYETKDDLLDALISYCKSGLENKEYCLWIVTDPLTIEEARDALKAAVPGLNRNSSIEILSASDFFLHDGKFDRKRVTDALFAKLADISAKGYTGVRLTGDTSWVTKKDWTPFCELEEGINEVIGDQRLAVLCSYSLEACGANEILDAVRTHQFAIVRRQGSWDVIETAAVKRAKAEIKRLNENLEQRVAERTSELMKAEQRYRVMIETASDAVVCMDERGAILVANPATIRVFGYEPAELIGKPLTVLMPEFLRKAHEGGFKRYLGTGERHLNWEGTELTGLRKNGEEFPVEVTFGEVTADGHRIFTGFIRDIGERRQAEELRASLHATQAELARVTRLTTMGELAASIAHEVNQPLTAITNNGSACIRLLANRNLDPEVLQRALEEIVADGTRASAVISRIRAFIKKKAAEENILNINEVIQEMLAVAGHELQKNRILVDCQLTNTSSLVRADRVELQQVLLNLIMNGIEAMAAVTDRPRTLCVQSQIDESGEIMVSVRDSGTGLGADAERLFSPFFTTKAEGMGMGLSISRSLVEGHGGRLWATPNSPDGAVLSFTLPAAGKSAL
jgi:toluene monooxygenase system protein E